MGRRQDPGKVRRPASCINTQEVLGKKHSRNMRLIIIHILLLWSASAAAFHKDTLIDGKTMAEISIVSIRMQNALENAKDSLIYHRFPNASVGQLMEQLGWANVTSYGASGSLITARINGTASDHTVVYWNRMPITSPSLGLSDLSLLPFYFFDRVQLSQYSNQKNIGQGAIAGAIQLDSKKIQQHSLSITSGYNSMLNAFMAGQWKASKKGFAWSTAVLKEANRNEFEYIDVHQLKQPKVKQSQNNSWNNAVKQDVYWQSKSRRVDLRAQAWLQWRKNHIPEVMGVTDVSWTEQTDSLLRGQVGATFTLKQNEVWDKHSVDVSTSISDEYQTYTDRVNETHNSLSLDSRLRTTQIMYNALWNLKSTQKGWDVQADLRHYEVAVRNTRYESGLAEEDYQSGNLFVQKTISPLHLLLNGFVYTELRGADTLNPSYGITAIWEHENAHWSVPVVRAHYSRKNRVPDFNERFWVPGGNRDLLPEQGWVSSFHLKWNLIKKENHSLSAGGDYGYQKIENWIQWVPLPIWTPVNFKTVTSINISGGIDWKMKYRAWTWMIGYRYRFTRARGANPVNDIPRVDYFDMPYTPRNTNVGSLDILHGKWDVGLSIRAIDSRFTNELNDDRTALDPYTIYDLSAGYSFGKNQPTVQIKVRVENLLDESYQSVRSYAMPGRVYAMHVTVYPYSFIKSKK